MNSDDLQALARKYQTLLALRQRRDAGGGAPDRVTARALRELAGEFPGCLRELDTLGAVELARRAALTQDAAAGSDVREPWMPWISRYHALMRAAFEIRRRATATTTATTATTTAATEEPAATVTLDAAALAAEASRIAGVPLDTGFVEAVIAPPQGRIGIVVLRLLATLYQQPPRTIAAALFPLRRPSPYEL